MKKLLAVLLCMGLCAALLGLFNQAQRLDGLTGKIMEKEKAYEKLEKEYQAMEKQGEENALKAVQEAQLLRLENDALYLENGNLKAALEESRQELSQAVAREREEARAAWKETCDALTAAKESAEKKLEEVLNVLLEAENMMEEEEMEEFVFSPVEE